jgi:hypothetical protein
MPTSQVLISQLVHFISGILQREEDLRLVGL